MAFIETLEPRLQLARPEPSLAENVRFRLPLAVDTTTHYYYDRDDTAAARAWNGTSQSYNGHRGTDFSGGPRGRPVYAAADGILIAKVDGLPDGSIDTPGNGNYVRLNHGNDRNGNPINTVYLHFNAGTVTTKPIGSFIAAGEQIGGVGTSGHSTGLHLHFETQLARSAFDPFKANGTSETSWWTNQGTGTPSTTANTPKLKAGDRTEVYDLPGSTLNVRGTPAGATLGAAASAAVGTILEGPVYAAFSGNIDNNLWVWYRVAWDNGLTGWSTQNWLRKAVDSVAPMVSASAFRFETAPHKLEVSFSENVAASIHAGDLAVRRVGSPDLVPNSISYNTASNTATLNFNAVLPDGNYQLMIAKNTLADVAGNSLQNDYAYNFHVLAGDADRDGTVDFDDLLKLAQNYGQPGHTFSGGNFDYSADGLVGFEDLLLLAQRYEPDAPTAPIELAPPTKERDKGRGRRPMAVTIV